MIPRHDSLTPSTATDDLHAGITPRIPQHVFLDTTSTGTRGWVVTPDIDYRQKRTFPGTPRWELTGGAVHIVWSNGYAPTELTLRPSGRTLAGTAIAGHDVHGFGERTPEASVTLRRISCAPGTLATRSSTH